MAHRSTIRPLLLKGRRRFRLHPCMRDRLDRMKRSLDGLSVGDAFGECFFAPYAWSAIKEGAVPAPPWRWTDDTAMSLSIVRVLGAAGRIDRDLLARAYAERYMAEPWRGYG